MCGIFAYNGNKNSVPLLIEGLQTLEYRGYDSAGLFALNQNGNMYFEKSIGKVSALSKKVSKNTAPNIIYQNGIAHTRWATHGEVTIENTHPHTSSNDRFYIVHNGIIENYLELKADLQGKNYSFYSDTDSEIIAKLLEEYYTGNMIETLTIISQKISGSYAIALIDSNNPSQLFGIKRGSPMILGINKTGIIISSDIHTVSKYAQEFLSLDDGEIVEINNGEYKIYSIKKLAFVEKPTETVQEDFQVADMGLFDTFTQKEIHDIPEILRNVYKGRINFDTHSIHHSALDKLGKINIKKIEIIASGSSFFAGQVGVSWLKSLVGIDSEIHVSSEFLYDVFIPQKNTLYVFMSQSGETADVRECIKKIQEKGCHSFGIVNTIGSTIARMCDNGIYTHAGMEVGVASTKNVIAQLAVLLIIALHLGIKRGLDTSISTSLIKELGELPSIIEDQLSKQTPINILVEKYADYKNFFFLGRGVLQGTAQEASLKLKELSYLHSESYATGELKHGPLALISRDFPCFVLAGTTNFYEKTISNVKEIKARKGPVVGVVFEDSPYQDIYDDVIALPKTHNELAPFTSLIPLWIFAVGVAKKLGNDIDKPQNLAKSVTVE